MGNDLIMNTAMEISKQNPQILGNIYTDLAQPGVRKVSQALETVFDLCNTILLPIKLLNEKSKLLFQTHMNEYKTRLEKVPDEKICEVQPELGIPLIDKLTHVRSEEISNLYISLLEKASISDMADQAHPAFLQTIGNLSIDEARIINYLQNQADKHFIPYFNIIITTPGERGFNIYCTHLTGIEDKVELIFPQKIQLYIDNLCKLGIICDLSGESLGDQSVYEELKACYSDISDIKTKYEIQGKAIDYKNGVFKVTNFGKLFIEACFNNK